MIGFKTDLYPKVKSQQPESGKHILAQYDNENIIVYQAYKDEIADYALEHGYFGGEFSFDRMTWIKPNFLWMMYRSNWALKPYQNRILAIYLPISYFDSLLEKAAFALFKESTYKSEEEWRTALQNSDIRVQWDPDYDPLKRRNGRRAIQIGIGKSEVQNYSNNIVGIVDITEFVKKQQDKIKMKKIDEIEVPVEKAYLPKSVELRQKLGLI